jgi:hypothetical protein
MSPSTYIPREYRGKLTCMKQPIVSRSPEVMGGTAVFYGTRVPVQTRSITSERTKRSMTFSKGCHP